MQNQDRSKQFDQLLQRKDALLEEFAICCAGPLGNTEPYGTQDPLSVHLASCDACGSSSELVPIRSANKRLRWGARCTGCRKAPVPPQKEQWMAALEWNSVNLGSQCYRDITMFELGNLNRHEASIKVSMVRKHITLRIQLCGIERSIAAYTKSGYQPGKRYRLRLDAYLKWAMLAHRLIKNEQQTGVGRS